MLNGHQNKISRHKLGRPIVKFSLRRSQIPLQGASAAGAAGADPAGQGAAGGAAAGGRHHGQGGAHAGQQRGRAQHRHRREDRHRHQPAQLRRVEDEGRGLMFVLEYRYDTYDIWFYYSFPKVFIYFCVI